MNTCWNCNKAYPEGASSCPHCRAPLTQQAIDAMATIGPGGAPSAQIVPGALVNNRYEVRSEIGRGGMGIVYLAWDRTMELEVALKVIPQELCMDPAAIGDLKRETGIALKLTHDNIVRLYTLDTWEGQAFVVMEYVGGGTLSHLRVEQGGRFTLEQALPLLEQVAAALDYSHNASPAVIHRDLKPLNILLTQNGQVKVADFGLARVLRDSASRISGHDSAGTLAYMAPEQVRGKGIGRHTDIYALAAISYEMLAGHPPFHTGDLRWQIMHEEPEAIVGHPEQVNHALFAGLAKEVEARPPSAGGFVKLLTEEPVIEVNDAPSEPDIEIPRPEQEQTDLKIEFQIEEEQLNHEKGQQNDIKNDPNTTSKMPAIIFVIFGVIVVLSVVGAVAMSGGFDSLIRGIKAQRKQVVTQLPVSRPASPSSSSSFSPVVNKEVSTLTITPTPADATVRILNIKPKYFPGMELKPGSYQVEVSKPGYKTMTGWVELKSGQKLNAKAELEQIADSKATPPSSSITGRSYTDSTTGMEFVYVKGGCYQMGDTFGDGGSGEKPVHEVCVDDFYMGKYEVTQGEYRKIIGSNPSRFKKGDRYPVERVSWDDAQGFIGKLNQRSGKKYRLPTEAEWEYAAREGGKKVRFGTGKNTIGPDEANFDARSKYKKSYSRSGTYRKATVQVGNFRPNGLGLYDMSGNVWEWCQDWYGKTYYQSSSRLNPTGPLSGSSRVIRGGGWSYYPRFVRAAFRSGRWPDDRGLGFRLVFPVQ